jgi:hypothetical protein
VDQISIFLSLAVVSHPGTSDSGSCRYDFAGIAGRSNPPLMRAVSSAVHSRSVVGDADGEAVVDGAVEAEATSEAIQSW